MIANVITASRIILSIVMIFMIPESWPFMIMYILCGLTDVLDGFAARKMQTASTFGERLDSIADIVFAVMYAVRVLPLLGLTAKTWTAIIIIAVIKVFSIIFRYVRRHDLSIPHSWGNKITGLLIFILPLSIELVDPQISVWIIIIAAAFAAFSELIKEGEFR